jgi:hypothetical protein
MPSGLRVVLALGLLCAFVSTMDWVYWWTWVRSSRRTRYQRKLHRAYHPRVTAMKVFLGKP